MSRLDEILAALAHPARRAALRLIDRNDEICLCDIIAAVDVPQPNMSRHMRMLRETGLVIDRRAARRVLYRRNTMLDRNVIRMVDAVLNVADDKAARSDRELAA
jgi:ArsR family transcriptional regulator, arsenate/arsenite/antimonite-responsive transcriptional repressor